MGRTELAQLYFPNILPQTAWQKLRGLLAADPALAHLTKLKRRTFLPAEVNIIYHQLGQPWTALFQPFLTSLTLHRLNSDFSFCKLRLYLA